jgi:CRISPR-associated endonuclease Cas1
MHQTGTDLRDISPGRATRKSNRGRNGDIVSRVDITPYDEPLPVDSSSPVDTRSTELKFDACAPYWQEPHISEQRRFRALYVGGRGASISVRDAQLVVRENGREMLYMPGVPPFRTLLLESFGCHITGDALAWLHRQDIYLIITCDGEPISILGSIPPSKVELRQRQYAWLARPLPIARAILMQKIKSGMENERFTLSEIESFTRELRTAATITDLHLAEARAASLYFQRFNSELIFHYKSNGWPDTWKNWPGRLSPLGGPSPRNALHPINAILNCAYSVAAAQLTRALAAAGLDPAAGYLHQPKDQRTSLSYDALELLRADIDTRILSLLASRIWQRDDFLVPPHGIVRLTPSLARTVTGRALATKADLTKVCDWMTRTIMAA